MSFKRIPDHVDALRSMMADAKGSTYVSFETLEEASRNNAVLIMQGDEGGQIYLTYPAARIACSAERLNELLRFVDSKSFSDISSASIRYELLKPGDGVAGGMGGGIVTGDLWIHPEIATVELEEKIRSVFSGTENR